MNKLTWGKHAVALATFLLGFSGVLAAQTAATDPWRIVPAAPTSCYVDDDYSDKIDKASSEVEADIARQTELNAEIRKSFDAMDGMEKARRLQAFMMKNPQQAAKMMQGMQAAGNAITADVTAAGADGPTLDQELARHSANFDAAADKAVKPIEAKIAQLINTKTKAYGEAGAAFSNAADLAQYKSLVQQENTEYEKACAPFFGSAGTFPGWLASYKTRSIDKFIAAIDTKEGALVVQMAIMDTPSGGYRSTGTLEGIRDYLKKARSVYALRRHKAVAVQIPVVP